MIAWLGDGGAGEGGERLVLMPMIDGALAAGDLLLSNVL